MARTKCEYCGRLIDETAVRCVYCNTINSKKPSTLNYQSYSDEFNENSHCSRRDSTQQKPVYNENLTHSHTTISKSTVEKSQTNISTQNFTERKSGKILDIFVFFGAFVMLLFLLSLILWGWEEINYSASDKQTPDSGYYIHNDTLYYYDDFSWDPKTQVTSAIWWEFDAKEGTWSIYKTSSTHDSEFIFDFSDKDALWTGDVSDRMCLHRDAFDIYLDKNFIDNGNHFEPQTGYYYLDDVVYYYIDDIPTTDDDDVSGWYQFDTTTQEWAFYCLYDNKQKLSEILFYYPTSVFVGDNDASWRKTGRKLPKSFMETSWYEVFSAHEFYTELYG